MTRNKQGKAWAFLMTALAASPVAAQQDGQPEGSPAAQPPLWLISCSNQADPATLRCEFSQSIVLTQGNQRVATASFVKNAGQPDVDGIFTVPVGVHLPTGLSVSVDGTEVAKAAFLVCDGQGCHAEAEVDQAWLEAMRSGLELTLGVDRADRRSLSFTFQLEGFTATEALLP
ncbi:MAG: invasion associated locus B family protein [Pseudomonadota bacterium]